MRKRTFSRRVYGILTRVSPERRQAIYESLSAISQPRGSYYAMVAISTTIAAFGLLANSTAVVIGAMLVAPLMGPIFGMALALITGDRSLLRQASIAEGAGILISVALGAAIGLAPLSLGFGSEIAARTQPTLYDIIVAVASGLAGAYALVDERISPALPGVAIATALVPPLTTCGLCLATGRWEWAWGAFLLFTANFLSIEIVAAFLFGLFGIAQVEKEPAALAWVARRFGLSLVLLGAIAVFLTQTLISLVAERRLTKAIQETLSLNVRETVGASLTEAHFERRHGRLAVTATVLTPQEFEPAQVGRAEATLRQGVDPTIDLIVRSLISRDTDRTGPVFLMEEEREQRAEVAERTRFLNQAAQILKDHLAAIAGAHLIDLQRQTNGETVITAVVRTPTPVSPSQVATVEAALRATLDTPLRLVVRSIPIQVADASGFLYRPEPPKPRAASGGVTPALQERLEAALQNQLRLRARETSLTELRASRQKGRLAVLAVARGPKVLRPGQVRRMEADLRRYVDPGIDLVVRCTLGAEVTSAGRR
jgi:uncharacterized hydrophobic protein (TIGR00271 family)